MRILPKGGLVIVLAASLSAAALARSDEPADLGVRAKGDFVSRLQLGESPGPTRLPEASPPPDQGSRILQGPSTKNVAPRLQREFAEAFARHDPKPRSRAAHFAWLPMQIHVKFVVGPGSLRFEWVPNAEPNVWRTGWSGWITAVDEDPEGGARVTVRLQPRMYSTTCKTLMGDYVDETYRFKDGRIELIATDAATPRTKLQVFPTIN